MSKQVDAVLKQGELYMKYENDRKITWCGGCGNYGIQNAVKRALALEGVEPKDVLMCFDVGCVGNGADKIEGYTLHGLHGRVISLAAGAALANPRMSVWAFAGDGGTFSEGVNHLIHGVRNDYPIIFVLHNNENYGLTTGQPSALTRCGTKLNSAPDGVIVEELNACDLVLSLKPSFVARTYSGEVEQMTDIFVEAMHHNGFAFIEVLQACPTYNRETPDEWYAERVKDVASLKDYDSSDIWAARKICQDLDKEIYTGILYRDESRKSFLEKQTNRVGVTSALVDEVKPFDISKLL